MNNDMQLRALIMALSQISLPVLSDSSGRRAAMSAIRPLWPGARLAGPAFTVSGVSGDNLALHRALYHCPPGCVLVAALESAGGYGHWGELMSIAAHKKGIAGLVINGAVRDPHEIEQLGFPVFATGVNPRKTSKNDPGLLQAPVVCAGMLVHPGDIVIGDEHGVLALPAVEAPEVLVQALALQEHERLIAERLRAGERLADILHLEF